VALGLGPNCQLTGNGYRSCVTPTPTNDVIYTNHCGWLGILCDVLPINSAINCWNNPNFDQCATAAIDIGTTATVITKGAKLAAGAGDALSELGDGAADGLSPRTPVGRSGKN
jgi:hypothetical protein